jgi:hypothetical protein
MAKGNEIGTFSHRSTSATLLPGPGGGLITQVNFEGEATSFGTVAITATFVGGNSGTFSAAGRAYLENGDFLTGIADNGSFESVGPNRWKTSSIWRISNGSALLSEGEIDLASRAWSGKNYEWN